MNLIQTKNFQLATYSAGDKNSFKFALVLPGKLDTKDYPHMRNHVDFLAGKGYFALSFDPPGTWESPGDIKLYTTTNYLKAINELIEYFENRPTFVMGHSRGGSLAMLAGINNPYIIRFASIMSYYSFNPDIHGGYPDNEWKKTGYKLASRDIPNSSVKKEFKLPYSYLEDQILYDMSDGLKKSTKPKLFVFGKKDVLVKPEIVKKAYEIASAPKKLRDLDSGHDYRWNSNSIKEVNNLVEDFLQSD